MAGEGRDEKAAPRVLKKNSTAYPAESAERLRRLHAEYLRVLAAKGDTAEHRAAAGLKYYQYLVRAVLTDPGYGLGDDFADNGRGLLVYHAMGMGKTFLAVATAMAGWDARPPLVIVAKALQGNFAATVRRFVALLEPHLGKQALAEKQEAAVARFEFVSLDAYNMATQVAKATTGSENAGTLRGRLLIVDEAHNFFRGVINSPSEKTNARRLYEMVMAARDLRILFLTGTPSAKDPFELVPCFNMLAGYELLPTQYEAFGAAYVDRARGAVKNRGLLANRLLGLVSHVGHGRPTAPGEAPGKRPAGEGFPVELETRVERVEMAPDQYARYLQAREKEEAEGGGGGGGGGGPRPERIAATPALSLPGSGSGRGSTYYVRSRSLGNFAPPLPQRGRAVREMPPGAFTAETSPKIARLVANLEESPGPALVYSQFVDVGGLAAVKGFLRKAGYAAYSSSTGGRAAAAPARSGGRRYATISGDVRPEERARAQEAFNAPANARGAVIAVLLVSKTGAEGLDLKGVRQIHLLEPYWDKAREDQVKARGVRLGSHAHLPPASREVRPFLYLAVANAEMFRGMQPTAREAQAPPRRYRLVEERTIDEAFHARGLERQRLNEDFRALLREVCLECAVNGYEGCRRCEPTGGPLYHADYARDLRLPDPCRALVEEEVGVRELPLAGEKGGPYFYRRDPARPLGVVFYEYDAALGAHAPVDPATGLFMRLRAALQGSERGSSPTDGPQGAM